MGPSMWIVLVPAVGAVRVVHVFWGHGYRPLPSSTADALLMKACRLTGESKVTAAVASPDLLSREKWDVRTGLTLFLA